MKKFRFAFYLICFSVFFQPILFAQTFNLDLTQTLVIGEEKNDSTEYIFSAIRTMHVDEDKNIYLANTSDNAVRIFNKNGKFIRKIGQRGRGPGDFMEVTSIETDLNDSIIVADRMQERISIFDTSGKFIRSSQLEAKSFGTLQFVFKREDQEDFIIAYRDYENYENDGYFFNVYNQSLDTKISDHFNLYNLIFDPSSSFEKRFSISPRYLATKFGQNQIAVVSYLYTGEVVEINTNTLTNDIFGKEISNPYTLYEIDEAYKLREEGVKGIASLSGRSGRYMFKQKGANFGLVGNSRFLLQFYVLFEDKRLKPFLNIYSTTGEKLANISLENSPVGFVKNNLMSFSPYHLDEENNLYASDYYYKDSFPAVRVFKTNLDELVE